MISTDELIVDLPHHEVCDGLTGVGKTRTFAVWWQSAEEDRQKSTRTTRNVGKAFQDIKVTAQGKRSRVWSSSRSSYVYQSGMKGILQAPKLCRISHTRRIVAAWMESMRTHQCSAEATHSSAPFSAAWHHYGRQITIRSKALQFFGKLSLMPSASHHPVQCKVVGERQLAHVNLKSSLPCLLIDR